MLKINRYLPEPEEYSYTHGYSRVFFNSKESHPKKKLLFGTIFSAVILLVVFVYLFQFTQNTFAAATSTINFQARLEGSDGAIVPDGCYNVEFKLYSASSGGTNYWTEDYLNTNSGTCNGTEGGVEVSNGYLTANLGSVNPFSNASPAIPWSQQLYLGINIGGTTDSGSPTWDGEMSPRLLLTAVPYAFQSEYATSLQTTSGSDTSTLSFATPTANNTITIPDDSGGDTVCLVTLANCSGTSGGSGDTHYIENQTSLQSSANFDIQSSSIGSTTGIIEALSGQTAGLLDFVNSNYNSSPVAANILSGFNDNGQLYYTSGSYTGTIAQNTLSGSVTYDLPAATGTQTICLENSSACGFAASSGSGSYINNSSSPAQTANFNITGTGQAGTSFLSPLFDVASGTLQLGTSTASAISIGQSGITTTNNGPLTATGLLTANGGFTSTAATNLDTTGSSALNIGTGSYSGDVYIGNSGAITTLAGSASSNITFTNFSVAATGAVVAVGVNSGTGLLQGTGGLTLTGATNINTSGSSATNVGTGSYSGTLALGNSSSTTAVKGNSSSSIAFTNFNVASNGLVTLLGGLAPDITTATASTANTIGLQPGVSSSSTGSTSGATLTLQGGNDSGAPASGTVTGGTLSLLGGNATGASGTRDGGNVTIDAGTGATANGNLNIGTSNSATTTLGRTGGTTTINGNSSSSINFNSSGFSVSSSGGNYNLVASGAIQGNSFTNNASTSSATFQVNTSGNETLGSGSSDGLLTFVDGSSSDNGVGLTLQSSTTTAFTLYLPTDSTSSQSANVCVYSATYSINNCGFATSSADGSYIENQNSSPQSANFDISGTGEASTLLANTVNVVSGSTLSVGTIASSTLDLGISGATTINEGNTSSVVSLVGSSSSIIAFGTGTATSFSVAATTGVITLQGGNSIDLTTPRITGSLTTPNSLTVEPGINSYCPNGAGSGTCATTGANLDLYSGDATGWYFYCVEQVGEKCEGDASGISTPGEVNIDTGTSLSGSSQKSEYDSGSSINIGPQYASTINIGDSTNLENTINEYSISEYIQATGLITESSDLLDLIGSAGINLGSDGTDNITITTSSSLAEEYSSVATFTIDPGSSSGSGTLNLGTGGTNAIHIGSSDSGNITSTVGIDTNTGTSSTLGVTIGSISSPYDSVIINGGTVGGISVQDPGGIVAVDTSSADDTITIGTGNQGGSIQLGDSSSSGVGELKLVASGGTNYLDAYGGAIIIDSTEGDAGGLYIGTNTSYATQGTGSGNASVIAVGNLNWSTSTFQGNTVDIQAGTGGSGINIGTANAVAISIGKSGATTTNNGAFTSTGLLTANGGIKVTTANGLTLGTASSYTGGIIFDGSGGAGTLTLVGPTTPNTGNYTLTIPTITAADTVCTNGTRSTSCSNYAPSSGGNYIQQVPTTTAQNTITPATSAIVGLTVNGTNAGTAAYAVNVIQGYAATALNATSSSTGDAQDVNLTNTSGTQTNGLYINRNGASGTTTNLLNLTNTAGTATNAISLSGTFTNLITSTNFGVTNAGAVTGVGVNSGGGLLQGTGGLTLTGTTNINTSGSSAINVGTGSYSGTLTIGNSSATAVDINAAYSTSSTEGVIIGAQDGNQTNLVLDGSSTFLDAGTCSTSVNDGALYYNTNAASVSLRTCIDGSWRDVITNDDLGIMLYGVVPDSGSYPGDLASNVTNFTTGPCKVSYLSSTSVSVSGCTLYTGGRKIVQAATTITSLSGVSDWYHLCYTGSNDTLVASAGGAETANMPAWSATTPVLCLADVETGGSSTITNIYDTRVFTTDTKTFGVTDTAVGLGWLLKQSGTSGQVAPTNTSGNDGPLVGVVGLYSGTVSTTTPNVIYVTNGPTFIKTNGTSTVALPVTSSGTSGYSTTTSGGSSTIYGNLGVSQLTVSSSCSAANNCQYSQLVNIDIR